MLQIVSSQVIGEAGTGFEKGGNKGPFECGNCEYMSDGLCHQETMNKVSKQRRHNGHPIVDEHDCCEYVDRKGSKKSLYRNE